MIEKELALPKRGRERPGRDVVSRQLVRRAQQLAREVAARALIVSADAFGGADELRQALQPVDFRTILVSRSPKPEVVGAGRLCGHSGAGRQVLPEPGPARPARGEGAGPEPLRRAERLAARAFRLP